MTALRLVAVNLLGVVEHPRLGDSPYRVDRDGRSYVQAGDGGIVLDLRLGDSAFGLAADHAAPGACLVHPDPASRHALASYACIGNQARVRTGLAAGARGVVLGQRGEEGRVIVGLAQADLARVRPGDEVAVRACGQGLRPPGLPPEVTVLNLDPDLLGLLPVGLGGEDGAAVTVGVRMTAASGWPGTASAGPRSPGTWTCSCHRPGPAVTVTCCWGTWSRSLTSTPGTTWGTGAGGSRSASSGTGPARCPGTVPASRRS